MTSNIQLDNYIKSKNIKGFIGVFSSDEIWNINIPRDSSLIVNYSASYQNGSHWVAMRHLNCNQNIPEYFDSYGFKPDHDDKILGVRTRFLEFIQKQNKTNKPFRYNKKDLQSYGTDVCGEYSAWFIINGLPILPDGMISPQWRSVLNYQNSHNRDKYIKKLVGIRKTNQRGEGIISLPRNYVEILKSN